MGHRLRQLQSPANDPYVITVGAARAAADLGQGPYKVNGRGSDRIATYSSRGPSRLDLVLKPDIVAPGNRVISLCANGSSLDNYAGGTNDIPNSTYIPTSSAKTSTSYFPAAGAGRTRRVRSPDA